MPSCAGSRAATATRAKPPSKRSKVEPRPSPFRWAKRRLFSKICTKRAAPLAKTELLEARLKKLSPLEAQYVVKILTGDLRIGLREGLVEEAIARAFDAPLDDLKEAHMLLGDIGQTALLAARHELDRAELTLFRPIKVMLASPEPTAEAIWDRFAKESPNESVIRSEVKGSRGAPSESVSTGRP